MPGNSVAYPAFWAAPGCRESRCVHGKLGRVSTIDLHLRPISTAEHTAFLERTSQVSFLQRPEWAQVKGEWRGESLGWFAADELVGAALVLHRGLPVVRKTLAYIPDGPVIDFSTYTPRQVLSPLVDYLKAHGAFQLRLGPGLMVRSWAPGAVRKALGKEGMHTLADLEPKHTWATAETVLSELQAMGFAKQDTGMDFAAGQPEYVARIDLHDEQDQPLDADGVRAKYSSTTRNEARKALRGPLEVEVGGLEDMDRFHALYRHTADRNEFTGRPLSYFKNMYLALNRAVPGSCTLYLASHEGTDLAASIVIRSTNLSWYIYGASSSEQRKLFAPKAIMERMIADSIAAGSRYLDQGGVSPTLEAGHHLAGLTKFKTNTGCDIIQTTGEWDLALIKPLAWAFDKYMTWRAKK